MTDIVKAIEKEKEYLAHRMKGEEPFHLVDAVKEFGFETLEQYFAEKRDYELSNLSFEVVETTSAQVISEVYRMMGAQKSAVMFVNTEYTHVWHGSGSDFNEDYCVENSIPVYPLRASGGTIVCAEGDFSLIICLPESFDMNSHFILTKLAGIFEKYTDGVAVVGNDILRNGQKICGSAVYQQNEMKCFEAHISFNDNAELIEIICQKKSGKVPGHIDFMTRDELRQEVAAWLKC